MAKHWMLLLVSILVLFAVQQGALAQFSGNSDDGCSNTPDCAMLTTLLSGCNGTWQEPPPGSSSGEYGVDYRALAPCMCTEQYYGYLEKCLACYQRMSRRIIPASRPVYAKNCEDLGVTTFKAPEKKSSTKTILIVVLASAAVLIIAAAVLWFVYIKFRAKRESKALHQQILPQQSQTQQPVQQQLAMGMPPPHKQPSPQIMPQMPPSSSPQIMPQMPSYSSPQTPSQTPYQQPQQYMPYPQHPQHSMYIPQTPIPTAGTEVIPTPGSAEHSGVQEYYPPPSHPPPSTNTSPSVPAIYYASSMPVSGTDTSYLPPPGGQPHDGQLPSVLQPGGRPLSDMNREPSPSSS